MFGKKWLNLPVVIAAVLGLGFGASAYLNVAQHQRAEAEKKLLQGEITDLRYQVKQDQEGKTAAADPASETPSEAEATPTPTPVPSPAVAGTASISIGHLDVKLTATDPIADLTYAPEKSGSYTVAAFTTQALVAKYPACKAGALGSLVRKLKTVKPNSGNQLIKPIGSYNYYYIAPAFTCATDTNGRNEVAAAAAALKTTALPTLAE